MNDGSPRHDPAPTRIEPSAARAIARIVPIAPGQCVALPPYSTLEVLDTIDCVAVPGAPAWAMGLVAWQGQWLPLLDLDAWRRRAAPRTETPRYALVVQWFSAATASWAQGAIALQELPWSTGVQDAAACALPADLEGFAEAALACFVLDGLPVPVLAPGRMFGG